VRYTGGVTSLLERVAVLGEDARYDRCRSSARPGRAEGVADRACRLYNIDDVRRHITVVQHPKGPMPLLRVMQTNVCTNDCYYCGLRARRDVRRETFRPEELARFTDQVCRAGLARGLFLSSGVVGGGDASMEPMVATAEILRVKYGFRGYLHLKIMPAAGEAAIAAAVRLADRVSVNLEAPTAGHLARLTTTKALEADLVAPLYRARAVAQRLGRHVSRTTQYVVGAAGESDRDILQTTLRLYREAGVARAYYSAFSPVPDTPLDCVAPENPLREHRLYQADFLLRQYGFEVTDLPLDAAGQLPRFLDPKLAWARSHPEVFPVEVTRADRTELLRVPGLGPKSVEALLGARRVEAVRSHADLRRLGISLERTGPWITVLGRREPVQLPLPIDAIADEPPEAPDLQPTSLT
jgi:predicted DNA-binding helix-hairpin-helix protein